MHMVSSDPYHGGGRTSLPTKQRHRTALTMHIISASAAQTTTGTVAQAPQSRYHTRELLGRGGMSEVYRGFDVELRRPVAIKRLRPDLENNPGFRARFRREAQAAGRLSHSAIVAVFDTGEERDETGSSIPFIVMELVEGRSLRDVLCEAGKVPPWRALELTSGVLDALACSHAAGIVHRDIKPANVMLTSTGGVKVADFGIARAVSDTSGTLTLAGTVVGTPQYLSPEQGRGGAVDARSDIYSVGCMLYELLVGEPPFTGDSPLSIVVQHVSDAPARPSAANGDISTDIDSIVLKALAKDPAGRYQTASEMKADVERILGGHQPAATALLEVPVAGPPEMLDRDAATAPRRNAAHLFAIIIGVLVIASASAFGGYRSGRPATAALSTTDVPAVLGLGRTDAESVLRNAHLVPRFEFVHRADVASLGTVIKQSPNSGDTAATNSTVAVIINIGSPRDDIAIPYAGVARRPPTWPTSLTSSDTFSPDIRSRDSSDRHAQRSDTSARASVTHPDKTATPRKNPESPRWIRNLTASTLDRRGLPVAVVVRAATSYDRPGGRARKGRGRGR